MSAAHDPPGEPRATGAPARDEPPVEGAGGGEVWGARRAMEVLAIAFVFPLSVFVGFAAGRWVGERLDDPATGAIVGGALGAVAGFWELYHLVRRLRPR